MQITNNGPFIITSWYDNMLGDCIELINSNEISDSNPTGTVFKWNDRYGTEISGIKIRTKLQTNKDYILQKIDDYISENL